jgi:hypothetical protein
VRSCPSYQLDSRESIRYRCELCEEIELGGTGKTNAWMRQKSCASMFSHAKHAHVEHAYNDAFTLAPYPILAPFRRV